MLTRHRPRALVRAGAALPLAVLAAALAPLAPPARAQTEAPDAERLRPPALIVRPEPGKPEVPLEVSAVRVDVEVVGDLAIATLDLTFTNPNDRVLEGRFVVPLPHGAAPSRFAMDVDGAMREGVVVERERARVVFETIVRAGVDPGLLEWVKGNAFQARVYPIPAKGTKRVMIGYEWELDPRAPTVRIPLGFEGLVRFACDVRVRGASAAPLRWPLAPGTKLESELANEVDPLGRTTRARVEAASARLDGDLVVPLAARAGEAPELWTEDREDGLYFVLRVPVEEGTRARPAPRGVALFWDASGSREQAALEKERALIARWLKALGGDVAVTLIPFSDERWPAERFEVKAGDASALIARLGALEPDGGTRLGAVALGEDEIAGTDLVLLVSDGLETLARGAPDLRGKPVVAIASSSIADHARLAEVAGPGNVVDLGALTVEQALEALRVERVRLLPAALPSFVKDVEPAPWAPVTAGRFTLAGRLERGFPKTRVELRFGYPGAESAAATVGVDLDPAALVAVPHAARIWAKKRVARLLGRGEENEVAIQEIGRRFSLVTPFTSMLVLETLQDYIRYEVVPPKEWQDDYFAAIEGQKKQAAATRAERIAKVTELWKQRVAWWETTFEPPPAGWRPEAEKAAEGAGGAIEPTATESAPGDAGPPLSAPAPRAAPGERMREAEESPSGGASGGASAAAAADERTLDLAEAAKEKKGAGAPGGGIELKPWSPDRPYLKALAAAGDGAHARYLALKGEYAKSPAFFLDVADWFFEQKKDRATAMRVLSNLAELDLESAPLLRVLAHRYRQMGALELAAAIFAEVRRIRPEEPQSHRDLGLVLADLGRFEEAIPCLEAVVLGEWDGRFPEVELVALGELNQVIARCRAARGGQSFHTLPEGLIRALDVDVRIVLSWDADQCDMDLWVVEPTGEKAFYSNTRTRIGGWFGRDFTGGYGPEEYLVKKAIPGTYKIQVNYYGSRQQTVTGATTIQVEVIRNYGRPDEVRQAVTRRLASDKEVLDIAEVRVP